jgi:hypothetical protein
MFFSWQIFRDVRPASRRSPLLTARCHVIENSYVFSNYGLARTFCIMHET